MTDADYDVLERRLRRLAPDHALFTKVGARPSNTLAPVVHETRLGSLDNAFDADEITAWITRTTKGLTELRVKVKNLILSPKLDGLSVQMSYRAGKLLRAATRGDGNTGEDVTANALAAGAPATIEYPIDLDVRGEAVVEKSVFAAKLVQEGYSNERNAAAGILRAKDGRLAKHLRIYVFDASCISDNIDEFATMSRMLDWLEQRGFSVAPYSVIPFERDRLVEAWENALKDKVDLPYLADGMVARLNKVRAAEALGWSDTCPRGAIACKWRGQMVAETTVTGVHNKVGRTGVITPVAILAPVACGGVTVSKASLMNWDEIARLGGGIGNGSRVAIERAGEVIPRVTAILSKAGKPFTRPESCPSCNAETFEDGPRQVCRNPECPAQTFRKIMNWIKVRDIKHLGEETLDRLMSIDGPVAVIADLYDLTFAQLKWAAGGGLMAKKILRELEKSRTCTPAQYLGGLGIKGIGPVEADKIVTAFKITKYRELMDAWECPKRVAEAVGPVKAERFVDGLAKEGEHRQRLWKALPVRHVERKAVAGSSWNDKTFCITGPTEVVRNSLIKIVEAAGGRWKSSVVRGLDYLITNDTDSGTRKNAEAVKKGVRVITEQTALDMAGYK